MTNLVLQFTNLCFAATLETSPDLCHWRDIEARFYACPSPSTFTIPRTNAIRFFRLRLGDNGIVPTPAAPFALVVATNEVWLSCGMVFNCADDPMSRYRWIRNGQELTNAASFITDHPGPGWHNYSVQAIDGTNAGWQSPTTTVYLP